ncbi:MAG: HAMP domain-containing sensor histidine kinase [Oscillospiraceae bacterium]|nr:HAMP domain-containing sensor histidine kinase [Oscillospiraceae bacterium]
MKNTLKSKAVLSFAVLLILSSFSFAVVFNWGLDQLFQNYATLQQERRMQQIVTQINNLYIPDSNSFRTDGLEAVGNAALQNGMILHVQSINDEVDWDISSHRAKECQLMLQHRERNMHSRYPNFEGSYQQSVLDLTYQGQVVGTLTLGYYGPYTFDDIELQLINSLNRLLIGIGVILLLIAAIFGSYLAMHLTRPIHHVVNAAQKIARGDYQVKIQEHYKTKEISELITAINEMAEQLRTKELQKQRLTADVAHELRTPLCNLQSHMEAVIDEVWEPTPELFRGCCDEIQRLTNIVNQLKELTEYEDHRVVLDKSNFQVSSFFDSILSSFAFSAKEKKVRLIVDCQNFKSICLADEQRIKQCIINLVSNAIKYTENGGTVKMTFKEDADFYYYDVSDTGIGIPSQDIPQLFERFYRVDESRARKTGGMGIGLSITKAIIEMHGGAIWVNSVVGQGSVFSFKLPKNSI